MKEKTCKTCRHLWPAGMGEYGRCDLDDSTVTFASSCENWEEWEDGTPRESNDD